MATVFALCVCLKARIRYQWVKASVLLCLSVHRPVLVPVCVFAVMSEGIGQALFRTVWSRRDYGHHGKCLDRLQLEFMTIFLFHFTMCTSITVTQMECKSV